MEILFQVLFHCLNQLEVSKSQLHQRGKYHHKYSLHNRDDDDNDV